MSTRLTTAANRVGPIRSETLMGREYRVYPAVLVREQVLRNNLGSTFLPASEIEDSVDLWNGTPVVLRHPSQRGQPISARSPDVMNSSGLGFLYRARFEDGALKADVFIDAARTRAIPDAGTVIEMVEAGGKGEGSTGFGTMAKPETGTHDGQSYDYVLQGVYPDHYAVLVEEVGACSVEDGCGIGANASTEDTMQDETGAVRKFLAALSASAGIFGDTTTQEDTMDRDAMLQVLADNGIDEEMATNLTDCQIKALSAKLAAENEEPDVEDEAPDTVSLAEHKALLARMAALEEAAAPAVTEMERERSEIVAALVDNERCPFGADELSSRSIAELRKLAAMAQAKNYGGRPVPSPDPKPAVEYMPVRNYWETPSSDTNEAN